LVTCGKAKSDKLIGLEEDKKKTLFEVGGLETEKQKWNLENPHMDAFSAKM
jgi:hypothetical protein